MNMKTFEVWLRAAAMEAWVNFMPASQKMVAT